MDTPQPTGGPPTDDIEPKDEPGSGEVPGPDGGVPAEGADDSEA